MGKEPGMLGLGPSCLGWTPLKPAEEAGGCHLPADLDTCLTQHLHQLCFDGPLEPPTPKWAGLVLQLEP